MEETLIIKSVNGGARLVLGRPVDPFDDDYFRDMPVELFDGEMTARTVVRLASFDLPKLSEYFKQLAARWVGWAGERAWQSLEGELELTAQHDGLGHVRVMVTLRPHERAGIDDGWAARSHFVIEAGEQMNQLASAIDYFVAI